MIKGTGSPQQGYTLWEYDRKHQHLLNNKISHLYVVEYLMKNLGSAAKRTESPHDSKYHFCAQFSSTNATYLSYGQVSTKC